MIHSDTSTAPCAPKERESAETRADFSNRDPRTDALRPLVLAKLMEICDPEEQLAVLIETLRGLEL